MWGRGGRGTGSLLSSQASWRSARPGLREPPGSGAWSGQRCHPGAQTLQPPPPRAGIDPHRPGLITEQSCLGWQRSQTAARGGGGGLRGSLARIKYLLCFVWPLGEGREDCRIDPELRAKRGGPRGAGGAPAGCPEPRAPRGEDSAAEPPAALTDLGYRAPGRRCGRRMTPRAGAALLVTPRPPPSVLPATRSPSPPRPRPDPDLRRSGRSAEAALGRVVSIGSWGAGGGGGGGEGDGRELDAGPVWAQVRPQSPGPPRQARPASGRSFLPRCVVPVPWPAPLCHRRSWGERPAGSEPGEGGLDRSSRGQREPWSPFSGHTLNS